jgi:hypothetical protein
MTSETYAGQIGAKGNFRFADRPERGQTSQHKRVSRYLSGGRTDNFRVARHSRIITALFFSTSLRFYCRFVSVLGGASVLNGLRLPANTSPHPDPGEQADSTDVGILPFSFHCRNSNDHGSSRYEEPRVSRRLSIPPCSCRLSQPLATLVSQSGILES